MFILCTYADGPYWPSSIEPLLYPSGCTFHRTFSYREEYIDQALVTTFKNPDQIEKLITSNTWNKGIFGLRFREEKDMEYRGKFVPLRRVRITEVKIPDKIQINFSLEEYLSLSSTGKLQTIPLEGIIDYSKPENKLLNLIPSNKEYLFEGLRPQENFPQYLWDRFTDDEALSAKAKENFKGTMVLRLVNVKETGGDKIIKPESFNTRRRSKQQGYKLTANRLYDLEFAYNRLIIPGESEWENRFDFVFKSPKEIFEISDNTFAISGNYRQYQIWISPKEAKRGSLYLKWIGVNKTDKTSEADPKKDKILSLVIPVLITSKIWTTTRKWSLFGSLLSGAFVTVTIVLAFITALFKPLLGNLTSVFLSVSSLAAAFLAFFIQALFRGKFK